MLLHYRASLHHNDFEDIHIYHHVYDRLQFRVLPEVTYNYKWGCYNNGL